MNGRFKRRGPGACLCCLVLLNKTQARLAQEEGTLVEEWLLSDWPAVCLWALSLLMIGIGRPSPLWAVPPLGRRS